MAAVVVVLLVVGFVLLALEIVVIPGFGVAGIAGLLSLATGSILAWRTYGAVWGAGVVAGTLLVCGTLLYVVLRTRLGRSAALNQRLEAPAVPEDRAEYVGRRGVAVSLLRPAGLARFGDEKLAVITEGQFVEPGTPVEVVRVEAGRLVVVPLESEGPS